MIGLTFGPYRVQELLGAGGMGEVYRAYDSTLYRYVALKVLPQRTSTDLASVDRLRSEARTLASLNHPNIAVVFGLEEAAGRTIVVMELVEGTTLAERISGGRVPLAEALSLARQIADALEAAHAIGVVHRDIKPSNIKVTPEKRVKVLDFGLARLDASVAASTSTETRTLEVTRLAGTPSYMSPEQALGQPIDARADIWAFGCVVYELITGYRSFEGNTTSEVLAAVLEREPRWDRLPSGTPAAIHRLLRRCLERDVSRRLRHIADARLEIDEALDPSQPVPPRRRAWTKVATLVTIMALSAAGWWVAMGPRETAGAGPSPRFSIELADALAPEATRQPSLALSPDGWILVYVGEQDGERQLLSRTLGRFDTSRLPGTEGAEGPFFSPNGEWVGFAAAGKLKKISLRNGSVVTICDAIDPRGATWGDDDVITFAAGPFTGLSRVSANGGAPTAMTTLGADEATHRWPQAAPGGQDIVFTIGLKGAPSFDDADVAVHSVARGQTRRLLKGTFARYVNTGHVVFLREGSLMAAPVDRSFARVGPPFVAVEGVGARPFSGTGWYAVAHSGTVVYASALGSTDRSLVWVDRAGRATPAIPYHKAYATPRLSPDGSRVALTIYAPDGTPDLWIYELERGSMTRLTSEGLNTGASWSPDGKLIAFTSRRAEDLFFVPWVMTPDGGEAQRVRVGDSPTWVTSWAPDGQRLAISQLRPESGLDILIAHLDGTVEPEPFLQTRFTEGSGMFSPDGRWLAYMSDESGRLEIYLRDVRQRERRWAVSVDGGTEPVWSRSGTELYFRRGAHLMAVSIDRGPADEPRVGPPVHLFEGTYEQDASSGYANFDAGDQRPFLMLQNAGGMRTHRMTVVLNWFSELRQRALESRSVN
ncbi:MAG TPA: protein kinase [Vicinamibacterales bacterium]|nr:protein kinase [Vicinamibacterales bacterium]